MLSCATTASDNTATSDAPRDADYGLLTEVIPTEQQDNIPALEQKDPASEAAGDGDDNHDSG